MDSIDVIDDSADERKNDENSSVLDYSVEDSLIGRPSYEGVVEESFVEDNVNTSNNLQNTSNQNRYNSYISSDEDVDFAAITRSARKPRVRRIASDSEDEYEQAPTNYSFMRHRSGKPLDSDEDEDESSDRSLTEASNTSNLKEIVNESPAAKYSFKSSHLLEPLKSDEDEDTSVTEAPENLSLKDIVNKSNSANKDNEIDNEFSSSLNNSFSLLDTKRTSSLKNENSNKLGTNKSKFESSTRIENILTGKVNVFSSENRVDDDNANVEDISSSSKKSNVNKSINESFRPVDEDLSSSDEDLIKNENSSPEKRVHEDNAIVEDISSEKSNADKSINESFRSIEDISSSDEDVFEIPSSDEGDVIIVDNLKTNIGAKLQQTTIDSMVKKMSLSGAGDADDTKSNAIYCSAEEYANQSSAVANLRTDILRCKNVLRNANLASLPDKGALLTQRHKILESKLSIEEEKLKKMVVEHEGPKKSQSKPTWEQLQTNSNYVVPNTVGKQAMNTFAVQKTLTMDRLKHLHDSLATCPSEDTLAEDPKGLKIELMHHQKRALAWLMWRENQKPAGGILADDMGLGKTLTMISLILATIDSETEDNASESESEELVKSSKWTHKKSSKYKVSGGTLVICPATLIKQWECEIENRLKRNLLSTELYHGVKRESSASRLAKYDVVITTYKLAQGEFEKNGPLYNVKWKRIILDEAHVIRNPKSQTSIAICALKAKSRWALTGTPVHNKELDLYALLKFLRCSPFDDLAVWKRWVANKNAGGQDRLNTVITSILLRRTKTQLQEQGDLQNLPEKKFEVIEVSLDSTEKQIYQKVLIFSRTLFIEFLRQRAEKNPEFTNIKGGNLTETNDEQYNKMHKKVIQMHGNTEVKSHEILVLLLRLRQICCHPSLISSMLDQADCAAEGIEDEEGVDMDMLDKLNKLNLDDETPVTESGDPESLNSAANKVLSSSNPVFAGNRPNEKLRIIQNIIEEKVIPNGDKIIIVSQWTSMLNIIMCHLKEVKIKCDILDGKVPVHKRNDIVLDFNNPSSKNKVLLLSLTAGGVGLNLIGANHLLLVDLHWNPQLESQAQDRIYRVGQKKTVYIYKIVTSDTIEERIKALQDRKLSLASDLLSGVRPGAGSKLSLDDLKMLFNVAN